MNTNRFHRLLFFVLFGSLLFFLFQFDLPMGISLIKFLNFKMAKLRGDRGFHWNFGNRNLLALIPFARGRHYRLGISSLVLPISHCCFGITALVLLFLYYQLGNALAVRLVRRLEIDWRPLLWPLVRIKNLWSKFANWLAIVLSILYIHSVHQLSISFWYTEIRAQGVTGGRMAVA